MEFINNEVYISVDIETDGPIPGDYSIMSIGAASFDNQGNIRNTFEINLKPLPGAKQYANTMSWWEMHPEAYEHATKNQKDPKESIIKFIRWVHAHKGIPVFVGYPAGFDFTFMYWYMIKFCGFPSPFSFSALDIKSYAMAAMGSPFRKTIKKNMPKEWFSSSTKHTHKAVEDAIEQGKLFFAIRNHILNNGLEVPTGKDA